MAVMLLFTASCGESNDGTENNTELNIIDDNYRNWYEIFVHSYYDTNNDGIGDLKGVTEKLDYIKDLGFNGIWLMPISPSPTYHKYDVTDYYAIDPQYGTLDDLDELVSEAHNRGIKVILDLVLNHSSNQHPWFKEACQYIKENGSVGGSYGDYYNFVPQNLADYTKVDGTPYYYEARFWSGMPDLNLDSEALRAEIVNIMKFWLDEHGVDGFRLDAVTSYYTGDVAKNVEFLSWVNRQAKAIKSDCFIVGEAWVGSDVLINEYYKSGVDSFFLFTGSQGTGTLATIVKQQSGAQLGKLFMSLQETYTDGILAPFLGNHDTMRPGSFMPGEENVKMAGGVLAMMNGGTFVYYGEEIGMISKNGSNSDPAKRIAMKWSDENVYKGWCYMPPEGITVDETCYYFPSVEAQTEDENSILNYYKQAMTLRNRFPAIARGTVEYFPEGQNNYICVVKKSYQDESIVIVINLDSFDQTVTLDKDALQVKKVVGELCVDVNTHVSLNGSELKLPPQSIAILK